MKVTFTAFRMGLLLIAINCGIVAQAGNPVTKTSVVNHPPTDCTNVNYTSSRSPYCPRHSSNCRWGVLGTESWIGRYLELQRDGLTGHLGEISAWLDKNNNAWLTQNGDHGWEEVPYWLKGYSDLAYILNDKKMIAET